MVFMSVCRLITAGFFILNIFQTYNTPLYGQVLWNPLHLLVMLTTYPLLFAYMFSLMRPESVGWRYWQAVYIPSGVLMASYLFFNITGEKLPYFGEYAQIGAYIGNPALWALFVGTLFFAVELCVFTVLTFRMHRQHTRNLPSDFSYTEGSTLGWIRWNIIIILLKGITALFFISVEGRMVKMLGSLLLIIEPVISTIWVIRQKELYRQPVLKEPQDEQTGFNDDNAPLELSFEKRKKLHQDLLWLLKQDEIFKDPDLNSEKVREMLGTNRTYLSQLINQEMGTTFYQLINKYRLNKSVEMMKNPEHQHIPLRNIAEICGFKSLGAFSTFFKQVYGKTPTEWRTTCQISNKY
jgi:AraC-like DNA-binding protein